MMHKFKYYVEKFQKTSCVGCGRCMRTCPVDMNLAEMLTAVAKS
jgi:ferredoxin